VARIYTRTGDDGTTGLIGGTRTTKDSPLIEACGELDQLNAMIGLVRSNRLPERADKILELVQNDLFTIGIEIMTPEATAGSSGGIRDEGVLALEREIDAFEKELEPLRRFLLPGGSRAAAELHLTRATARRIERRCIALAKNQKVSQQILCYLNRLSDLFFVMARYLNRHEGVAEPCYAKSGS
jgi:cob(I)alamin adenosyltransferase